ncbi:MAG: MFS transporter, partial [Sporomusa sp.]
MSEKGTNRWLILAACMIINLCLGAGYAWSVFQKPLIDMFGWTTAQTSLAFTISFGIVPLAMIACGKIQDARGPKVVTIVGGVLFGLGMFCTGMINSLTGLYLTYGIMGGIGIGMAYGCTVATPVKWFPDKRGLAGGMSAAGFGSGAIVFAPLAASLIEKSDVLTTFRTL